MSFFTKEGEVRALDGVDFSIESGRTLGLVGESGCGKSVTALSILRLLPKHSGRIKSGEIWFENLNLAQASEPEMRDLRGKRISMIFQDPMTSLNPVVRVGSQITEAMHLHEQISKSDADERAVEMLTSRRDSKPWNAPASISARTFGRNAPAGHDRNGSRLQPPAAAGR